jgi:hypothetical protein
LNRLGRIVNRDGVSIVSNSVEVSEYRSFLSAASYKEVFGTAYSGLAIMCASMTERTVIAQKRFKEKVAYIFEKGEREHEIAHTLNDFEKRRTYEFRQLRSHHFLGKDAVILQPADLIAGVVQQVLLRAIRSLHTLSNGRAFTLFDEFKDYYSGDGVTASVIPSYNGFIHRVVANRLAFQHMDERTVKVLADHPDILDSRLRVIRNRGKKGRLNAKNEP